ncbi:teichoic acid biosynthesis protein C [Kitasatospora sp. NPDC047058]|uniref:phage baseplate protein n=1 Tax=Kitasatospora sp. NPDC047058 TaxID=3155620 RepID=UPI0033ED812E
MINDKSAGPSRRSILTWGGTTALAAGTVLAAGAGPAAAQAPAAAAETDPSAAQTATPAASSPALRLPCPVVDVSAQSQPWRVEKTLEDATVLQSFAFDNVNRHVYLVQVTQGGRTLSGESGPVSGAARAANGDLTITKWDYEGTSLGRMHLRGCGHGVGIGVEPSGGDAYLWTEAAVPPVPDPAVWTDNPAAAAPGFGTRITRFKFENGKVLDSASLVTYEPAGPSTYNGVAVDPVHGRLLHRYVQDGTVRYRLHDLDQARKGVFSEPVAEIAEPQIQVDASRYGRPTFQGFTVAGRYLYLLHGDHYGTTQLIGGKEVVVSSKDNGGNTFITSVDLTTGQIVKTARSMAFGGDGVDYREPEGLAIQIPEQTRLGVFRLVFGFAYGAEGARKVALYTKDELL